MEPMVIPNQGVPNAANNTDGLQSIEISISKQQITEQLNFTGIVPFDILQHVRGQYLDYVFDLRVESVKQNGILYTCECCTDIDEIFYTPLNYSLPSVTLSKCYTSGEKETASETFFIYPTASDHAREIANALGLELVMKFKDFYSTVEVGEQEESGATYADLIRDIFGWSSRVPTELINVYIRNGTMYVIQRGYESHLIDISGAKMAVPIFSRELVRMYYKRSKWSKTEVAESPSPRKNYELNAKDDNDDDDDGNTEKSWLNVEKIITEDKEGRTVTFYSYTKDGVLKQTIAEFTSFTDITKNTRTTTNNYYDSDGLLERTIVEALHPYEPSEDTKTVTTYGYMTLDDGKKFLSTEMIEEYVKSSSGTAYELENTRVTTKSPTGRGQGATADNQGNVSASGNTSDDRVTPRSKKSKSASSDTQKKYRDIDGFSLIDTSFPIQDISSEQFDSSVPWDKVREGKIRVTIGDKLVAEGTDIDSVDTAKGRGRLEELTEAIKWLNRKTKETVTITLYEFPHLIDFNDRILLFGKEYFLVRNTATTTPRVFNEQQITLERWF